MIGSTSMWLPPHCQLRAGTESGFLISCASRPAPITTTDCCVSESKNGSLAGASFLSQSSEWGAQLLLMLVLTLLLGRFGRRPWRDREDHAGGERDGSTTRRGGLPAVPT